MSRNFALAILSDVHYACLAEQAEGDDYEYRGIANPLLRWALRTYRHFIWLRYPLRQNAQLDRFLAEVVVGQPSRLPSSRQPSRLPRGPASVTLAGTTAGEDAHATTPADYVIAIGDYCCNTAGIGLSDEAAMQSARECLGKVRQRFGEKLIAGFGDHELGKLRLHGTRGGMRLNSWRRAIDELGLRSFWKLELGNYVLLGVVSSLVALPVFESDMLPDERSAWEKLREQHLAEIRAAFTTLQPRQRVLLFCHDPTALPFLWRDEEVRSKLSHVEQTIIGHLHSNLVLKASKLLAGMPAIRFLGYSMRRLSTALNEARLWQPFHVRLCPSLAGIELLKDGGYLTVELDPDARQPARFTFHRLRR